MWFGGYVVLPHIAIGDTRFARSGFFLYSHTLNTSKASISKTT